MPICANSLRDMLHFLDAHCNIAFLGFNAKWEVKGERDLYLMHEIDLCDIFSDLSLFYLLFVCFITLNCHFFS